MQLVTANLWGPSVFLPGEDERAGLVAAAEDRGWLMPEGMLMVNGTHIPLMGMPNVLPEECMAFYNYKSVLTVNVQAVCDINMLFRDVSDTLSACMHACPGCVRAHLLPIHPAHCLPLC